MYSTDDEVFYAQLMAILNSASTDGQKLRAIKKNSELVDWIDAKTQKLDSKIYDISVKIVWLKMNYTDFPCCETCGQKLYNKTKLSITNGYCGYTSKRMYCCHKCALQNSNSKQKRKKTCIQKYGVEHAMQSEITKQKIVDTCMEKYGVKNGGASAQAQEKIKKTLMERYSVDSTWKSPILQERSRQTIFKKYGAYNNMQSEKGLAEYQAAIEKKYGKGIKTNMQLESFKEKSCKTRLERYGDPYYIDREKAKQTRLERYGDQNYNNHEQYKQTMIQRYGNPYSMQNRQIRVKASFRYYYDNKKFDSSPEVAFYIYHKDHGIEIEYQPKTNIVYVVDGVVHHYFPDFKVGDRLVELKGDHFIAEDGTWQNPYDHSKDSLYEAKHQCAIANNIEILTSKDYSKYLDYIDKKYGSNYIAQFKRQNNQTPSN